MGDRRPLQAATAFRVLAFVFPVARLVGSFLRQRSLELDSAANEWGGVLSSLPLTCGLSAVLYMLAAQLRQHAASDAAVPQVPAVDAAVPAQAVAEPPVERLLDRDAPVDLSPFLPKEPPKMTAVPIGDPHGAFRRPTE